MKIFTFVMLISILCLTYISCQKLSKSDQSIMSRWAADVTPENVHSEYPRPNMERNEWLNLNGLWEYVILPKEIEKPSKFDGKILVPFPVESALSDVKQRLGTANRIWYRRTFAVPDNWSDKRIILNFEAVDWETHVWVNDQKVGGHSGGYDPFSFDITEALTAGKQQELIVSVWDPTNDGPQPRGKQVNEPGGIYYTPVSGIWQTVWLEPVPHTSIESFYVYPDINKELIILDINCENPESDDQIKVVVNDADGNLISSLTKPCNEKLIILVKEPRLWSPDRPYLYYLEIELMRDNNVIDNIKSYFGMRKISLGKDEKGITRIMFNDEFLFQVGTLDQGFWPGGIYTAPTDEALKYDIEITKQMGFNMLRKHVKIESRRFYY